MKTNGVAHKVKEHEVVINGRFEVTISVEFVPKKKPETPLQKRALTKLRL